MASFKLTYAKIKSLTKPGTYNDGAGLNYRVRSENVKDWVYRYSLHGKPHWMGLGSYPSTSLVGARELANAARKLVKQGIDPINERNQRKAEAAAKDSAYTFAEVADAYIAAHSDSWKNAKHKAQWRSTLDTYAIPTLGRLPVDSITTEHVIKVLEPIWKAKTETASRLRGRIETILQYATARKWRTGQNPAQWRGHLKQILPAPTKIAKVSHHSALHWKQIGGFMKELSGIDGVSALALRFTILTAARTGECIGARWSEINMNDAIWTIPPGRMKAGREHRVPLSTEALKILAQAMELRDNPQADGYVFPGSKKGACLSNMSMTMVLRRMNCPDITVHGFRSTFRDWCSEATDYSRELAEAALAHTLKDKTEAAYQRGDMLEKRRALMNDWAGNVKMCPRNRRDPLFPHLHHTL
jgi:integrase